jgi:hypothetical protein
MGRSCHGIAPGGGDELADGIIFIREHIINAINASDGTKGTRITCVDLGGRISENNGGSSLDRETWTIIQHAAVGVVERLDRSGCVSSKRGTMILGDELDLGFFRGRHGVTGGREHEEDAASGGRDEHHCCAWRI